MSRIINSLVAAISSKRVWTIIILFLINGVGSISEFISPGVLEVINPILLALGIIFGVPGVKKS